jgi:hypothetical protein
MKWFKHDTDASNDKLIHKLIIKYGAEGYAVYFHCLELIAGGVSETNVTFELEHDSEIIADNLKIKGTAGQSGIDRVEEIMRYIVSLELFTNDGGRIRCLSLARRLESSGTSNPAMRKIINGYKSHDTVLTTSREVMNLDIELDIELDKELDKENTIKDTQPARDKPEPRTPKKRFGQYKNVLLTETEYHNLGDDFPNASEAIDYLSEYREMKGYKAKSDYLAIRKWVFAALTEQRQRVGGRPVDTEDDRKWKALQETLRAEGVI